MDKRSRLDNLMYYHSMRYQISLPATNSCVLTFRLGSQASQLFRAPPGGQQATTVSHLENQLACCLALQSGKEYHHWLLTYVRYLVQEGK